MALVTRVCAGKHSLSGLFNRLCKVSKYNNIQVAHISGRINRVHRPRPPPFPYREKELNAFYTVFDYNIERFDENSRIIVVEGPIAAGKDKFARELAKELDMAYMPAPTFDRMCVDGYGNDIRKADHVLPERIQMCDIERFLTNPKHANVPAFEVNCYMLKMETYAESLLHLLSTGEGVVVNRSLFSNFVFVKAMYNAGYINKKCASVYYKVVDQTLRFFMKPHIVIYLDVPVNVVQERIKERSIPYEVNSKVLTEKYLTDIETAYKEEYLELIKNHAYVLMYDWASGGDIYDVVEDIERINLEYDNQNPDKLKDWIFGSAQDLQTRRLLYSHENRHILMMYAGTLDYDMPEFYLLGKDVETEAEFLASHSAKYELGYNSDKGDKGVLWKTRDESFATIPRVITNKELLAAQ